MDRTSALGGAVGAALFVGSVILLLPPTHTKNDWTSAVQTPSVHVDTPRVQPAEPAATPVAYTQPRDSAPAVQPDREDEVAPADEATAHEISIAEADRAYGDGYAWARQRDVEAPRECRRLAGPGAEGCRDYVASLEPNEPDPIVSTLY
jgi:hypothetical protein